MDPHFDPALLLLAGHLVHDEQSRLRRKLLHVLAKHLEVPWLRFCYEALEGRHRKWTEHPVTRFLFRWIFAYPVGRYGDTGHPMISTDVLDLLDAQRDLAIAIGPCRCRVAHGRFQHMLETDMVIRTGTDAFQRAFPDDYRVIDRDEAKRLIQSFADEGFWHMVFVHCYTGDGVNEYAICNCCRDGCVPFLLNKHLGQKGFPLLYGEHVAHVDANACQGCGECLDACPWEARYLMKGLVCIEESLCYGCGLCARACPNDAIELRRERPRPPLRTYQ